MKSVTGSDFKCSKITLHFENVGENTQLHLRRTGNWEITSFVLVIFSVITAFLPYENKKVSQQITMPRCAIGGHPNLVFNFLQLVNNNIAVIRICQLEGGPLIRRSENCTCNRSSRIVQLQNVKQKRGCRAKILILLKFDSVSNEPLDLEVGNLI